MTWNIQIKCWVSTAKTQLRNMHRVFITVVRGTIYVLLINQKIMSNHGDLDDQNKIGEKKQVKLEKWFRSEESRFRGANWRSLRDSLHRNWSGQMFGYCWCHGPWGTRKYTKYDITLWFYLLDLQIYLHSNLFIKYESHNYSL